MSEDASAGAATATADQATPAQQDPGAGSGAPEAGTHAPTPGVDDRSPEQMLAEAVGNGDEGSGDGGQEDALKTAQAEIARWKKQARENEKRAKENAQKAKDYDTYTESQKSEIQRATERATAGEQEATKWQSLYHRTLACANYDIPLSLIDQIQGSTEDEINASAEGLSAAINERAATLAAAQAKVNGGAQPYATNGGGFRGPVESLRPGALPASDNKPRTPEQWLRDQITKR